ncbi:TPPC8 protein, partial [Grus americana]|nr:TPPC8 protein [Grus americana]
QELPEMVLLKFFRPENTPVPARPTPELSPAPWALLPGLCLPATGLHGWRESCKLLQMQRNNIVTFFFSPEALEIHGSFTWLGQTQYKLQLKSQEVYSLQLKACFVHTGVYNLGTPRVFAKLVDQVTLFETSQQNSMP